MIPGLAGLISRSRLRMHCHHHAFPFLNPTTKFANNTASLLYELARTSYGTEVVELTLVLVRFSVF